MSETLTHFQTTSHDILNLAAACLSAAPDLTDAERTARSQTVVRGVSEFRPADPPQTILAGLILGHFLAIMDGFRDIARLTLTPPEAARARMVTVAQTKLVLQTLREMRIERKEAATRAPGELTSEPAADATNEAPFAKFISAYTKTLSTVENTDTLTPAAAAQARETLSQALFASPRETNPIPGPVTGSRAQRRAMMKRNGAFKRTA